MNKLAFCSTVAIFAAASTGLVQADDVVQCASRPNLAGPCYQVRGRLNAWNGGGATEKIWVIGTKHLLAVADPDTYKMIAPKPILDNLKDFFTQIYADYEVCPLEKEKPGEQGLVCVESAKNIRVELHETVDGKDHIIKVEHIPDAVNGPLVAE